MAPDDMSALEPPRKRFKHQSYKSALQDVHVPSAVRSTALDDEPEDDRTHLYARLQVVQQINLSPAFVTFQQRVQAQSASVAVLLLHADDVVGAWIEAVSAAEREDDGLAVLVELLVPLVHDLRDALASHFQTLLHALLAVVSRSRVSPRALTAALASLTTLFRVLLKPELLEETYAAFINSLRKTSSEVQDAAAEVWAAVLRRFKTADAVRLTIADIDEDPIVAFVAAHAFCIACKSASAALHTAAPTLVTLLLDAYSASPSDARFKLARRVVTALTHHCAAPTVKDGTITKPSAYATVAEALMQHAKSSGNLDLVAWAVSVRKGSRWSKGQLTVLANHIVTLPASASQTHVRLASALVLASDMTAFNGVARPILEWAFTNSELGLDVCAAVAGMDWSGWKVIGLPLFSKRVPEIISRPQAPTVALHVLADLCEGARAPPESDTVFWDAVYVFSENSLGEDKPVELRAVLKLTPVLPRLAPRLTQLVDALLARPYSSDAGWTLGTLLAALAQRSYDARVADATRWVQLILNPDEKWTNDEWTLDGLAALVEAASLTLLPAFEFGSALRSHHRRLRLAALRLLVCTVDSGREATLRHILAAEESTLDVAGVRGRTVRITTLPPLLHGDTRDVALPWLLSQLKVNLRPVWEPAIKALAEVAARWPDELWDAVWLELDVDERPADSSNHGDHNEEPTQNETERTWRDPGAFALDARVRLRVDPKAHALRELSKAQRATDRLDAANYEAQLLRVLGAVPQLAERHSRLLAPRFLDLAQQQAKTALAPWLALFAQFANPKALYRAEELRTAYLALLAHPERALQRAALTCIVRFGDPAIRRLEASLHALLDETRWRDEMASLVSSVREMDLDLAASESAEETLVRLCYGLMTERRAGRERRAAALTLLGVCGTRALGVLVDLMLRPFNSDDECVPGEKQQLGFLAMLADLLQGLGTATTPYWDRLLGVTVRCVAAAQKTIDAAQEVAANAAHTHTHDEDDGIDRTQHEDNDPEDDALDATDPAPLTGNGNGTGAARAIRQAGLRRLAAFFRLPAPDFDFTPHLRAAFEGFISPRLAAFSRENTQAPSALLQMFAAWAERRETVLYLVEFDDRVLPGIYSLLGAHGVKSHVVARVLDVAESVLAMTQEDEDIDDTIATRVVMPHMQALLDGLAALVTHNTSAHGGPLGDLTQRQIALLSSIAKHVHAPQQAAALLSLFAPLLRRPPRVVPERVKADMLRIYTDLVPRVPELCDRTGVVYGKTYELLSGLFSSLRLRGARTAAASAFAALCVETGDIAMKGTVELVVDLNAFSTKRVEEPDFEARLNAFRRLNEELYTMLAAQEWLPVVHNLLFFIQDTDELSLRHNAAFGLRRFIDRVASNEQDILLLFSRTVYVTLKRALRHPSEAVRAEVLSVIAHGVAKCDNIATLKEMRGLLADGDEEANFFNNVCHIQVHRRTRALHRLGEYVTNIGLSNATLAQIVLPIISHPIYNSGSTDHLLVNEAISVTGIVAKHLSWVSYYALVRQYQKAIKEPKEKTPIKPLVRALVAILNNFHFPMDASVGADQEAIPVAEDGDEEEAPEQWKADSRIMDAVTAKLLPNLLHILENREETEDGLRIPITIGIVRIALFLPEEQRRTQVSRLLTIVSQIFRSKSQDTRDLTRETLCKIVVMLGPAYLPETMKQLRAALLRGPHLHILAFVTHTILVHVTANATEQFADLDGAVGDVAHVASEVIFGQSGRDVMSEDFKTKLKEVRGSSSRGLECFSLVSKGVSPAKLSALLLPVRSIMEETESAKVMLQVEDVLRRVASGLNANPRLKPAELLIMCHTLISQNAKFLQQTAAPSTKRNKVHADIEVKIKRTVDAPTNHYVNNSHRFIALGLDLFVTAARRSRFDLQNPDTLSRLEPMVNIIGNTLYSRNANVLVLGLKAAAAVIKYPLKNVDKALPVLVRQMLDIIKQNATTESEVSQTALKSLAIVMRDRTSSQIKEKELTYLLDLLGPDLEEHERQASVFSILRAIVSRKFIVPEIYDMMDRVAQVAVTSQSAQVQELCRGVLLQFYLDYPQGKGRLQKQMNFLATNLSYVYESGRKSVMELLGAILAKFDPTLMNQYSTLFFVALVMVMANDDSPTCREMAAQLVKTLLQVVDNSHRAELMELLNSWSSQRAKSQLVRVSIQVYGIIVDTLGEDASVYIPTISTILRTETTLQAQHLDAAETTSEEPSVLDWQLSYQLLTVLEKLLRAFPSLSSDKIPWPAVITMLLFPHAWVRTAAARLLGVFYAVQPPARPNLQANSDSPLSTTSMTNVARKSCLQLRGDTLNAQLSVQVTKNLVYLGKCFSLVPEAVHVQPSTGEADDDDESDDEDKDKDEPRAVGQLNWIFSRLSHQARAAVVARRNRISAAENWTEQPASILKFFAAMTNHLDPTRTSSFLLHILAPVQRILDEDTIGDEAMDALKALASDVQDLVQKKVGTTVFTEVYSRLRNKAMAVRRERREARALMVATDPQRAARRKQQHNDVKKESKKRKARDFREGRAGIEHFAKRRRDD